LEILRFKGNIEKREQQGKYMRADIFQKALMATARIACCAALFAGCNTKEPNNPTPKPDPNKVADSQPDSTPSDAAYTVDSCREHVTAVFTAKTQSQTEQTKQCCSIVEQEYEQKNNNALNATLSSDWKEASECCALLDFQPRGCYPWGPPCPPSMPS
jgi:hypothetical protein